MSRTQRYEFDSIDAQLVADSPELPEMFASLLKRYRLKCQSEERQQETIQSLLDRLYGRKSEKSIYHADQPLLLPELLEELIGEAELESSEPSDTKDDHADQPQTKPKRKGGHGRSKLPGHLERRTVERLDIDGPNCQTCDAKRPIDRGMPGVELLASIVIGKFFYHLPHYRQVTKTLKDAGINLSKQTVGDWTRKTAGLLELLWELMHRKLVLLEHLAADETTTPMVDRQRPGSRTKTTYLWQYFGFDRSAAPYTVFDFALTRAHTAPKAFLGDFDGTLLTDGYSAYRKLSKITHAGCMAHARRKFDEAMATSPVIAGRAVALIGKLYQVEKACKSMDADLRREVRRRESTGILLRLRLFLEQEQPRVVPQSKIAGAIYYALNQ